MRFRQCNAGCSEVIGVTCEWKGTIKLKMEGAMPPNDGHFGSYRAACYICWARSRYHKAWDVLDKKELLRNMDKHLDF